MNKKTSILYIIYTYLSVYLLSVKLLILLSRLRCLPTKYQHLFYLLYFEWLGYVSLYVRIILGQNYVFTSLPNTRNLKKYIISFETTYI